MFNPHSLSVPEITTVLAALGLVLNACISVLIHRKPSHQRIPIKDAVWLRHGNTKKRHFHE